MLLQQDLEFDQGPIHRRNTPTRSVTTDESCYYYYYYLCYLLFTPARLHHVVEKLGNNNADTEGGIEMRRR